MALGVCSVLRLEVGAQWLVVLGSASDAFFSNLYIQLRGEASKACIADIPCSYSNKKPYKIQATWT